MAGIWDRVVKDDTGDVNRINVSLLQTELSGIALGARTEAEAQAAIEAELGESLDAAELSDFNGLATEVQQGSIQSNLVYIHRLGWALNAAELGLTDETTFRSQLGI